jgi:hypothetical protein
MRKLPSIISVMNYGRHPNPVARKWSYMHICQSSIVMMVKIVTKESPKDEKLRLFKRYFFGSLKSFCSSYCTVIVVSTECYTRHEKNSMPSND